MPSFRPRAAAPFRRSARAALLALAALVAAACDRGGGRGAATRPVSLVAAGDIASCWWRGDEGTARLLDRIPAKVVAPLGDLVYQRGTVGQFRDCYAPTWGRHLERTRPTPGNHDYKTTRGAGYFAYFGARAGEAGKGWYAYELDGWRVVVLNSEEPIDSASEQIAWLREELRRNPSRCTLAYMHHPRFSSGRRGIGRRAEAAWRVFYEAGVDVVLAGHEHHYERFAPQDPDGRADPARGVRQFVVGTGGAPTYRVEQVLANSEARNDRVHGVLALTFRPDGYTWEFVPVRTHRFRDSGSGTCH